MPNTPGHLKTLQFNVDPELLKEDDFITILKQKIQEDAVEDTPANIKDVNPVTPEHSLEENMEVFQSELLQNPGSREFIDLVVVALQPSPEFKIQKVIFANPAYEQVNVHVIRKLTL
jgi:hypothetical protein